MTSRTTTSRGDYDLSDPVNSFVEVVRRVALQPTTFFADLPRQGSFLGPLVFALICIEISAVLVGLLTFIDVPGGVTWLLGARGNQGFLAFVGGAGSRSHSGDRGRVLDGAGDAPVGYLGGGIGALRVRGDLPDHFLLLGDEPAGLDTVYRVDLLFVSALPGHRRDPRDALDDHGQGARRGVASCRLDPVTGPGSGRRIGHRVLQGRLSPPEPSKALRPGWTTRRASVSSQPCPDRILGLHLRYRRTGSVGPGRRLAARRSRCRRSLRRLRRGDPGPLLGRCPRRPRS